MTVYVTYLLPSVFQGALSTYSMLTMCFHGRTRVTSICESETKQQLLFSQVAVS